MKDRNPDRATGFGAQRMSLEVAQENIETAYKFEKEAGDLLLKSDEHKRKAYRYMNTYGLKHLDVELADIILRLQITERTDVKYNVEELKKKLSKEIQNEVIKKSYQVVDIDTLKSVMKQYGVPGSILKSCLSITESVDKTRIEHLYDSGHIKVGDIQGCYELKESTSMKIKELNKR